MYLQSVIASTSDTVDFQVCSLEQRANSENHRDMVVY